MAVLTAETRRQEIPPVATLRTELLKLNPTGMVVDTRTGQKTHIDTLLASLSESNTTTAPRTLQVQEGIYREEPPTSGKPVVTDEAWHNLLNDQQIHGDVARALDVLTQYGLDYPPARQALVEQADAKPQTSKETPSSYDFDAELRDLQQQLPNAPEATLLSIIALRRIQRLESVDTQNYPNGPTTQLHPLDPLHEPVEQVVFPGLQPSAVGTPEEAKLPTPYPLSQAVMEHSGGRPVNDPIAMTATTIKLIHTLRTQLDSLPNNQREAAESQLKDYLFTLTILKGQLSELLVQATNDDALAALDAIDDLRQELIPEGENPAEQTEFTEYNPATDAPDEYAAIAQEQEKTSSPLAAKLQEVMQETLRLEGLSAKTEDDILIRQSSLQLLAVAENMLHKPSLLVKTSDRPGLAGEYENTSRLADALLHGVFEQVMQNTGWEDSNDTAVLTAATRVLSDIAVLSEKAFADLPARTQREFKKYQSRGNTLTTQDLLGFALVIAADDIAIKAATLSEISQNEAASTQMPKDATAPDREREVLSVLATPFLFQTMKTTGLAMITGTQNAEAMIHDLATADGVRQQALQTHLQEQMNRLDQMNHRFALGEEILATRQDASTEEMSQLSVLKDDIKQAIRNLDAAIQPLEKAYSADAQVKTPVDPATPASTQPQSSDDYGVELLVEPLLMGIKGKSPRRIDPTRFENMFFPNPDTGDYEAVTVSKFDSQGQEIDRQRMTNLYRHIAGNSELRRSMANDRTNHYLELP